VNLFGRRVLGQRLQYFAQAEERGVQAVGFHFHGFFDGWLSVEVGGTDGFPNGRGEAAPATRRL
jgi:hypothetical protein